MTPADSTPVRLRLDGLSTREVGGELVVLDLKGSQYFTVRGSGVYLFDLLHDERYPDELVTAVLERFEVDEETARRDVARFLSELSRAGLLTPSSGAIPPARR